MRPQKHHGVLVVLAVAAAVVAWLLRLPKRMRRLRLVHYNVKRFSQYEAVAATIEELKPDVVTLNEVDMAKLPAGGLGPLASRLGLSRAHFFGHVRGTYGNAILCDGGTVAAKVHLAGGSFVEHQGKQHHVVRGLLVVSGLPCGAVACTHLDHVAEAERATQAESVVAALDPLAVDSVVLAGDLNALRRADYGADEWAALEARNARNGWTPPADSSAAGGALELIRRAGFVDVAAEQPEMTSSSHCDRAACQRIDYVHVRGRGVRTAKTFVVGNATGSDHLPLVVDLECTP